MANNDIVKVIRVLEYIGTPDWVDRTLDRSQVRPVLQTAPALPNIREVYCSVPIVSVDVSFEDRPNTVMFRIENWNEGHTTFSVFIGKNEGARGNCGKLTLRTDEFKELMQTVFYYVGITCNHPKMALQKRLITAYCRACEQDVQLAPNGDVII